ncbi:MAG: hypothetical protein QXY62_01910 [Candidatus Altiarchaeota archaeon]
MKFEILTLLGILTLLVFVNAISDVELADMYYGEAKKQYDAANCINASIFAERAYNLYVKVGNFQKGNEVNEFRSIKVDKCLRDQGYIYYQKALEYYTQGGYGNYNLAKQYAEKAKEYYSYLLFPGDLIEKCDELIKNAENKIKENKKEQADGIYNEAYKLYKQRKDLFYALNKANEAKEIYSLINDMQGVEKCNALISNIQVDIAQIDENANVYYTTAQEWYTKATLNPTFKNFNTALEYAKNASELYSLVNNTAGYANCIALINNIQNALSKNEERLKKEAESYYNKAELLYLSGRSKYNEGNYVLAEEMFKNATSASKTAKQIYTELYNWADSLRGKERIEKIEYYKKKIYECNKQLEMIENEAKIIDKKTLAENLYSDANKFYDLSFYENASIAVNKSREIFVSINDWVGVSKCEALIRKINTALEILANANSAYEKAYSKYKIAEFNAAVSELEKAVEIYRQINRQQDIEKSNLLFKKIQEGNNSKNEADRKYKEALKKYEEGSFTVSKSYAIEANNTYKKINFVEGIEKCNELIKKNDEKRKEIEEREKLQRNILVAIVAIIFISVIIFWQREKWKKAELRKKALEAEEKRKEEERRKAEEERLKKEIEHLKQLQAERDRLKAVLEEEKKKLK